MTTTFQQSILPHWHKSRLHIYPRFWEIDFLRGVAIVMMVIYHLMWNLLFFGILTDVTLQQGFWKYFQRTTASMFLFLVGVSLVVSYRRLQGQGNASFTKFLWRGLKIFGWGMVISVVVGVVGIGRIDFGVLHLIGFSIIAAYPLLRYRWLNIGLWFVLYSMSYFLNPLRVDTLWLIWLGLEPTAYTYLDYFPIVPWLGVVLLGIGIGNLLYAGGQRVLSLPNISHLLPIRYLRWLGRHSLTIYLVHQPVLFALLFALLFLFAL